MLKTKNKNRLQNTPYIYCKRQEIHVFQQLLNTDVTTFPEWQSNVRVDLSHILQELSVRKQVFS